MGAAQSLQGQQCNSVHDDETRTVYVRTDYESLDGSVLPPRSLVQALRSPCFAGGMHLSRRL